MDLVFSQFTICTDCCCEAAEVAKSAYKQGRPIIDVAEEMTDIPRAELEKILEPRHLAGLVGKGNTDLTDNFYTLQDIVGNYRQHNIELESTRLPGDSNSGIIANYLCGHLVRMTHFLKV
jgi:hypothetical protein